MVHIQNAASDNQIPSIFPVMSVGTALVSVFLSVCVCVDMCGYVCVRWQVLSVVGCDPGVMKKPCPLITAA